MPNPQDPSVPNKLLAALSREDRAALEPHLETVNLLRGQVLYETRDTVRHAYFPHTCVISLVAVMEDGSSAEVALFGCEGAATRCRLVSGLQWRSETCACPVTPTQHSGLLRASRTRTPSCATAGRRRACCRG